MNKSDESREKRNINEGKAVGEREKGKGGVVVAVVVGGRGASTATSNEQISQASILLCPRFVDAGHRRLIATSTQDITKQT